jgi:hypothetical protein
MADNVVGGDTDPLTPQITPGAQAVLAGGDDDAAERRKYFRTQRERLERLGAREEELYAKEEKEEAPQRRDLEAQIRKTAQTSEYATNQLRTSQRDLPSFNADSARGDAFQWMSLAAGFGAIAGAFSRYHTTTALNAFSGMMNGWAQGQRQVFEQKYQEWQANSEQAREYNQRALREYKAIMDNAQLNLDAKSNLMKMTASKYQDQIMANAAEMRSVERMTQLMDAQDRFDQNLQLRKQTIEQHKDDRDRADKIKLAQLGMKMENGEVKIDPEAGGQYEDQAQEIYNLRLPPLNTGRSAAPINRIIMNRVIEIGKDKGIPYDATQYSAKSAASTSGARVAAGRLANLEIISKNLERAIPQAEQASERVPRGRWVPMNQLIQKGKIQTSDPDMTIFAQTNLQIAELWARAMNPTGVMREGDRDLALNILSTASDPQTYKRQLQVLKDFVRREQAAGAEVKQEIVPAAGASAPAAGGGATPEQTPPPPATDGRTIRYDAEGNPVQ